MPGIAASRFRLATLLFLIGIGRSDPAVAQQPPAGTVQVIPMKSAVFASASTGHDVALMHVELKAETARPTWPFMLAGGVLGGLGGTLGVRSWCRKTASDALDCVPYSILGGILGAVTGIFIGQAVADIVHGKH